MFENADLIHRYSRADALRDGVLVDVSATAREAGIRFPVALTRAVWERGVAVPPGVLCQDEAGRLWDVLWLLACAVRRCGRGPAVRFAVHVRNNNGECMLNPGPLRRGRGMEPSGLIPLCFPA